MENLKVYWKRLNTDPNRYKKQIAKQKGLMGNLEAKNRELQEYIDYYHKLISSSPEEILKEESMMWTCASWISLELDNLYRIFKEVKTARGINNAPILRK